MSVVFIVDLRAYPRSLLLSTVVCLSVRLSVYHKLQIASSLFLNGIETFFGRQFFIFFMTSSTKRCSSIFDLGALTPKIYSQKLFLHKIAYKSACKADRPEMFEPTVGVFGDGRFNGTMQNVGPTIVAMATKFGLGAEIQSPTGLY